MFKNYIKIAWRNLVKGKLYSIINISGLAVGIACCLLIGLYIYQELSYDLFHEQADQIYRVNYTLLGENETFKTAQTNKPLAPFLTENFSEIKHAIRLQNEDGVIRLQDRLFKEQFLVAEKSFLEVFSFQLLQGNPETAFTEREQILLTKSTAQKLFGSENVIGKSLELRIDGDYYQASVGGILEDPPGYSSITFEVVVPLEYWKKVDQSYVTGNNWRTLRPATYVLLNEGTNADMLAGRTEDLLRSQLPEVLLKGRNITFQPIKDIHFDSLIQGGLTATANVNFIYISALISLLILIIACINFMSISIGHSARRAREVGMRKAMGAHRAQVMKQFWGETLLVVFFSLIVGSLLAELLLPYFNVMVGEALSINWFENPALPIMIAATVIVTGLLAGSYPAVYLSKFEPSQVFRNKVSVEGNHLLIRLLSGIQFTLAITLIIGTLFMNRQMGLLLNRNLGFDKEFVIQIKTPFEEGKEIVKSLRARLATDSSVRQISGSWETFGSEGVNFQSGDLKSDGKEITGYTFGVGSRFHQTLDLEIVKGRGLHEINETDSKQEVLVNEELVKAFGWENPIGKRISRQFAFKDAEIVGVVKNFNFQSLHQPIEPLVMYQAPYFTTAYIRLFGGAVSASIEKVAVGWEKAAPGLPFDYNFLDQTIEQQYRADKRWALIVQFASGIAIFLACMGLFGLATLSTSKRVKEISIRKILGATATGVAALLSKDFLKPVLVALCVSVPLSYLLIEQWLQRFAYKIEPDLLTYIVAIISIFGLAMLTVSWQSIRAATANPVDSLRSE